MRHVTSKEKKRSRIYKRASYVCHVVCLGESSNQQDNASLIAMSRGDNDNKCRFDHEFPLLNRISASRSLSTVQMYAIFILGN